MAEAGTESKALPKGSFAWQGAVVRARKDLTIGDDERIGALMGRVQELAGAGVTGSYAFAEFMIGSVVEGTLLIPTVDESSPDAVIAEAWSHWRELPRIFGRKWQQAMREAEATDPN